MIDVINLNKSFGKQVVLDDVNVTINDGEKICIIGPSGSGKSTLLRCINKMEEPTSGKIIFEGRDILDEKTDMNLERQKIGMVFQQFNLFNHKTVLENIILAPVHLELKCLKKSKRKNLLIAFKNIFRKNTKKV